MNSIVALFLALAMGLSVIVGCASRKPDVLDGGEPLYLAQCGAHALAGQACE